MGELLETRDGWRLLLARIKRVTRRPNDAEDLLHAAYVKLEDYRLRAEVKSPTAFLVRAAANLAIDQARKERVRKDSLMAPGDMAWLQDDQPLQDEALLARKRLEHLKQGIAKLPPRTSQVFLMHRIDGRKYREIAEELGISVSAVEKHIARAALFLAEWVEGW